MVKHAFNKSRSGYCVLLAIIAFASGCSSTTTPVTDADFQYTPPLTSHIAAVSQFIDKEVERSIQHMISGNDMALPTATAVVADFVTLTANYDQPSTLGRYLAQAYITGLHQAGIETLEFQATEAIRVTPDGNIALTQDYLELTSTVSASAVMVGTITPSEGSYNIHARLVDPKSKKILGASQFYLSKDIVRSIDPSF